MKRSLQLKDSISFMSSSDREKSNTCRFCWILEGVTLLGMHTTPLCTCHLPRRHQRLKQLYGADLYTWAHKGVLSALPEYDLGRCFLVPLGYSFKSRILQQTWFTRRGPGSVPATQGTVSCHANCHWPEAEVYVPSMATLFNGTDDKEIDLQMTLTDSETGGLLETNMDGIPPVEQWDTHSESQLLIKPHELYLFICPHCTWFTTGGCLATLMMSSVCLALKLDTPIALTRPLSTRLSMAAQVSL